MTSSPRGFARATLLLLCTATALAACGGGADPKAAQKKEEQGLKKREAARVRVVPVEQREMTRVLSTTTTVESEKEVRVFSRISGTVTKLLVEEGDAVAEGAVLAEIDARDREAVLEEARIAVREAADTIERSTILEREAEAKVEAARLSAEQAARDYERNEKAGLLSQSALDGMKMTRESRLSDLQSARLAFERSKVESKAALTTQEKVRLNLKTRELELSYTLIKAPFAGVVAERLVKVGDAVGAGMHAFLLTDAENLRAVLHRPQRELALFAAAQHAGTNGGGKGIEIHARAEALPDLVFKGEIQRVSPSIDPKSGSFRVSVRLTPESTDSTAKRLLPGMLVRVEVVTDRHPDALVVPKRALRREGEVDLVFVARDGFARRVEVEEGYSDDTAVEVKPLRGELAPGDLVIVVGNRELEEGSEVEVEGAAPTPAPEPAAPPDTAAPGTTGGNGKQG